MLNLVTYETSDSKLLEKSYDSIKDKEDLEIVTDESEKSKIFRQTIDAVRKPSNSQFSFQNLFKLRNRDGCFYIAQCLIDFGYPPGSRGSQGFDHKYHFQIIGIANLSIDLGITHLRSENKLDKIVSRYFYNDIDFADAEEFSNKYYLVSNSTNAIRKYFDKAFLESLAKHDNILLTTNKSEMYISFDTPLNSNQTRIVQDVFSTFKYLAD